MPADKDSWDLIGRMYEAAVLPELWPDALEAAASFFGASCGHFFVWDERSGSPAFDAVSANYAGQEQYRSQYGCIDPRREFMRRNPPGMVVACHEHFDATFVRKNRFFNEFSIPNDRRFLLGAELVRLEHQSAIMAFHRPTRQGPFGPEQIAGMGKFIPHLNRAVIIQKQVGQLRSEKELAQAALDGLPIGVFVADESGCGRVWNRAAERIFAAGDGLRLERARLAADLVNESACLRKAVTESVATARRRSDRGGANLKVSRRSGARDYSLLVAPLAPETMMADSPAALVLIRDPEENPTPVPRLKTLYDLTDAEARLAAALLRGERLEAFAKARGVTMATLRTQLKSIFSKTRTARQAELIRVLSAVPTGYADLD